MKRDIYVISYNDIIIKKNAWNSSIRTIESIVRDIARTENTIYRLVNSESIKNEYREHVSGFRVWQADNGKTIKFTVEKV